MKTFLVDNGCQIYVNYFDILKVKNTKLWVTMINILNELITDEVGVK